MSIVFPFTLRYSCFEGGDEPVVSESDIALMALGELSAVVADAVFSRG